MSPISVSFNPASNGVPRKSFWELARGYAGIIDSRESTYRTFLDLTGYCFPMTLSAATRNIWNFIETGFETLYDAVCVFSTPYITKLNGFICSKFILDKSEQKDYLNYMNFQLPELEDEKTFEEGRKRIASEETHDRERISELFSNMNNQNKAEQYLKQSKEIKQFASSLKHSDTLREKIYQLKRTVIIGESFLEGALFAGEGLLTRLFRKHVLRQDQFTGTLGYSNDTSGNFGDSGFSIIQKLGIGFSFLVAPITNMIFLAKTKDLNKVKNNESLKSINKELDMTHGIFPKLWLLFTFLMTPWLTGKVFTAQDKYELFETFFKNALLIPSWWFGHRVTNGVLARHGDKKLEREFGKKGVLVEEKIYEKKENESLWQRLKKACPEPTRIQHVLDKTEQDEEFKKKAVELHAKTLYKGFSLHSFLIWVLMMGGNWVTKRWVMSEK